MTPVLDAEAVNQSPPYEHIDLFGSDLPLRDALTANGASGSFADLSAFGRRWGTAEMAEAAQLANAVPPALENDQVTFHEAYHRFMAESMKAGLHIAAIEADGPAATAAEVTRAARFYIVAQVENGHMCPITMTRASVAALRSTPALLETLQPKLSARGYDPSFRPWPEKSAVTLGMGMTEKQGGTDVRRNTTQAIRIDESYSVTGHKWFLSAPMSDGFLVLAQARNGLTCFFMPRFRPDGSVNGIRLLKLKDKLGNRSNASAEVEFHEAYALRVGEEGEGIRTILKMVQLTRLDCAIASAGIMRAGLARAVHHARHRTVFQKKLVDQPLMRVVLADMALDVEAAVALVMRLCRSFELSTQNKNEAARIRLITPAAKYWICKTTPGFIYEAMECLGGNGYVEESGLPHLFREAPVNAIWEGSGNVMALDVMRAARRDGTAETVLDALAAETKALPGADAIIVDLRRVLMAEDEAAMRSATQSLAYLAAGAALTHSAPDIAQAFARARFAKAGNARYGSTNLGNFAAKLLARVMPDS